MDGREMAARLAESVAARLRAVRLLSLDVDGVLTDGGIYVDDDGRQSRKFNVKDGMGMQRLRDAGVEVAIISAGRCPAVEHRAKMLGIANARTGVHDKLEALHDVCRRLGVPLSAVAHVGDDVNDVPVLRAVGAPMSVADAMAEARAAAILVSSRRGGDGAVREICEVLLALRGGS